jgi:ATP-binding cassette subfamily B protein RaxB
MQLLNELNFGIRRRFRVILQTEATECGLACIAMVAHHFGYKMTLPELRDMFPQSLKGTNLKHLVDICTDLGLGTRPLSLDINELDQLRLPAIIHWNFDHFVVLKSVRRGFMVIVDPAQGQRQVSLQEFSAKFTGVALEAWPSPDFAPKEQSVSPGIRSFWGSISGLRRSLFQIFAMATCLEALALLTPVLTQQVIDNVLSSSDTGLLNVLVIGFLLITLVQQVISITRYWAVMYFGTSLSVQWKSKVFSHLVRLPGPYFDRRHAGDIVSRFGTVDSIQTTVTTSLIAGILDGIVAISTAVLMVVYSAPLSAVPFAFMFCYAAGRFLRYSPLREATLEEQIQSAKVSSHFLETVRGNRTIKLFVRQAVRTNTWLSLLVNQINAGLRIQKIGIAFHSGNAILAAIENILVIWFGARLCMAGELTVGMLVAYIAYKNQFDAKITSLIDKYFDFRLLNVQMERLSDIVHTPIEVTHGSKRDVDGKGSVIPSVELVNVHFRYSPTDPEIVSDVSVRIQAGESVAIIGPSGCGKSTLASLLVGLHEPMSGDLLIDGKSFSELGLNDVRSVIGAVLQDDSLFAGTIEENICFFDESPDREWIRECARMAAIDRDINTMPMGYQSLIGDMGSALSGGQRQRLMLARALYKRPRILLLDEATSHLDPHNEKFINQQIQDLKMTRIVIAHRESTIASADRVLEMKGGRLVQVEEAPVQQGQDMVAP